MSNSCLKKRFFAQKTIGIRGMNRKAVFPFEFRPSFRIFAPEMLSIKTKLKRQGRGVAIRKRTLTDGRVVVDKVMKSVSEKLE